MPPNPCIRSPFACGRSLVVAPGELERLHLSQAAAVTASSLPQCVAFSLERLLKLEEECARASWRGGGLEANFGVHSQRPFNVLAP